MESGNRLAFSREIFEAGARLFHEGDPPGDAFVIESGKVEIAKKHQDDQVVVGVAGPGEMLGEMSLVDDSPRSATARASERTVALVVPHEVLRRRLKAPIRSCNGSFESSSKGSAIRPRRWPPRRPSSADIRPPRSQFITSTPSRPFPRGGDCAIASARAQSRKRLIPLAPVGSTGGGLDATRAAARPG